MTTELQRINGRIAELNWNFKEIMEQIKLLNQRLNNIEENLHCYIKVKK